MPRPHDFPPDLPAYARVIDDYQSGRIPLEVAARRFRTAIQESGSTSINLAMTPSIRRLLAEVNRLAGEPPVFLGPNSDRHTGGGRDMLQTLEHDIWQAMDEHPRAGEPVSITRTFAASTEERARLIANWLTTHGNHDVRVQSPVEADADDWIIVAHTSASHWSRSDIAQWAAWLRGTPLGAEASFTGWGV